MKPIGLIVCVLIFVFKIQAQELVSNPSTFTTAAQGDLYIDNAGVYYIGLQDGALKEIGILTAKGTTTGDVLTWDATSQRWVAQAASSSNFPQILLDASRTANYTMNQNYQNLLYNSVAVNVGPSYNAGNGTFTAPADGLYQISYNNLYSYTNYRNHTVFNRVLVNNAVELESANGSWTNGNGNGNRAYATNTGTSVVQLTAGQTVRIQHRENVNADNIGPGTGAGQHRLKIIRLK